MIARRAGATQYAEMFDDGHVHGRHGIHKRLAGSQEDADYEAYQGVLGRAGVDFPVLTGIPNTNFKCRDVGNGYFADLDTDCQVSDSHFFVLGNGSDFNLLAACVSVSPFLGLSHMRRRPQDLVSLSERNHFPPE